MDPFEPTIAASHGGVVQRSDGSKVQVFWGSGSILLIPTDPDPIPPELKAKWYTLLIRANSEGHLSGVEQFILEHSVPHTVVTFPHGVRTERSLQSIPDDLPGALFEEARCGLTGFRMIANQYRPDPALLQPQVITMIDGSGFGEVNKAGITVPGEIIQRYRDAGVELKNPKDFVDVFIQISAQSIRETIRNHCEERGVSVDSSHELDHRCRLYRGGDEFVISLFTETIPDAQELAERIIKNLNNARSELLSALPQEDQEKLEGAGAAIQARAMLGVVLKELEEAWEKESECDVTAPPLASLPGWFAVQFFEEWLPPRLLERVQADSESKAAQYLARLPLVLGALRVQTLWASSAEQVEGFFAELFQMAGSVVTDPNLEALPNIALSLNYAHTVLPQVESAQVRAAQLQMLEGRIEEQKITRRQDTAPVPFDPLQRLIPETEALIQRLAAEAETLAAIKERYEELKQSGGVSRLQMLTLYQSLIEQASGDGAIPGTLRSSVVRHLTLPDAFGVGAEGELHIVVLTLSGMRPINSICGMASADKIMGGLHEIAKSELTPIGTLRHMGDTLVLLCVNSPSQEALDSLRVEGQKHVTLALDEYPGIQVFAGYKRAGKAIAELFLGGEMASSSPTGTLRITSPGVVEAPHQKTVGDVLRVALG